MNCLRRGYAVEVIALESILRKEFVTLSTGTKVDLNDTAIAANSLTPTPTPEFS